MLVWPLLVAVGFVLLNGLVIARGASSTAGFDFERNRAREAKTSAAAVPAGAAALSAASSSGAASAGTAAAGEPAPVAELAALDEIEELHMQRSLAVSVAAHPAGKLAGPPAAVAWWLVPDDVEPAGAPVLAGPFADRVDAEWAAFAGDLDAVPAYGTHQQGRGFLRRPCPQDQDWLGELGDHLDRLSDDWTELVTDNDPLTTLVVELAAVLVEAGVTLRDGTGLDPSGGVCLTPAPDLGGILLSWQPHDRMGVHSTRGAAVNAAVQHTLSTAVADLLLQLGFAVESFGSAGCHLVRG